jgi:hypothetical protein
MSSDSTRPTSFEQLPTEILLKIFAFLPLQELVTAINSISFAVHLDLVHTTVCILRYPHGFRRQNDTVACFLFLHKEHLATNMLINTKDNKNKLTRFYQ